MGFETDMQGRWWCRGETFRIDIHRQRHHDFDVIFTLYYPRHNQEFPLLKDFRTLGKLYDAQEEAVRRLVTYAPQILTLHDVLELERYVQRR